MKELIMIQQGLKAPKGQYNSFGKYHYRSCEDILEAVKELLGDQSCILNISDELVLIGDRYYVKATATITNSEGKSVSTTAFAREREQGRNGLIADHWLRFFLCKEICLERPFLH